MTIFPEDLEMSSDKNPFSRPSATYYISVWNANLHQLELCKQTCAVLLNGWIGVLTPLRDKIVQTS